MLVTLTLCTGIFFVKCGIILWVLFVAASIIGVIGGNASGVLIVMVFMIMFPSIVEEACF